MYRRACKDVRSISGSLLCGQDGKESAWDCSLSVLWPAVEEKKFLKGSASNLLVFYDNRYWTFSSENALETFMRFPASYAELAILPPKLEAEHRLGVKPRTLRSIAEDGQRQDPPSHSLSSLASELRDAFTFLEVAATLSLHIWSLSEQDIVPHPRTSIYRSISVYAYTCVSLLLYKLA